MIEQTLRDMISSVSVPDSDRSSPIGTCLTGEGKERLVAEIANFIEEQQKEAIKKAIRNFCKALEDSVDGQVLEDK